MMKMLVVFFKYNNNKFWLFHTEAINRHNNEQY